MTLVRQIGKRSFQGNGEIVLETVIGDRQAARVDELCGIMRGVFPPAPGLLKSLESS